MRLLSILCIFAVLALGQYPPALTKRVIELHAHPSTEANRAKSLLPADPDRIVHFVRPKDTDPEISQFLLDHYAILYKSRSKNGKLFVFFPGTFGMPQGGQMVLDAAAQAGYLALGLEYVNTTNDPARSAVTAICNDNPDPGCAGKIRNARLFGGDGVARADSAVSRIQKALVYLEEHYPGEGWARFLKNDGTLDWSRVAVGGHSQGGGMAAFLAKQLAVARVCLFSGGSDYSRAQKDYAAWLKSPGATPPERYYALLHVKESSSKGIIGGYELLELAKFTPPFDWSPGSKIPSGTHILRLSLEPAKAVTLGGAEHASVAVDNATPKDENGRPAYREVWKYLVG